MKSGEKPNAAVIHRVRKRIRTIVSPETYEFLKNKTLNVGKLLDNAVFELKN